MAVGFSAKLPLSYSKSEGPYRLTKTLEENAKQNLKNLVFTIPGVKIEENTANLKVEYFIPTISVSDTLDLDIKDDFR